MLVCYGNSYSFSPLKNRRWYCSKAYHTNFTKSLINDYENLTYVYLFSIKMIFTMWQIAYNREDNKDNLVTDVHLPLIFFKTKSHWWGKINKVIRTTDLTFPFLTFYHCNALSTLQVETTYDTIFCYGTSMILLSRYIDAFVSNKYIFLESIRLFEGKVGDIRQPFGN